MSIREHDEYRELERQQKERTEAEEKELDRIANRVAEQGHKPIGFVSNRRFGVYEA